MPMHKRRVVVTQRFFDDETTAYLAANGCDVVIAELPRGQADGNLSHEQLTSLLRDASGWIVGHARVTRELLKELPDLQIVSRRGVGYERVDVDAVRELGRVVTIAVGGNDASVADHTVGLMLAVGRRLRESQSQMISGSWSILLGGDLYRKTVGVVGLGRIGRGVIQRLRGFEARILACTRSHDDAYAEANGVTYVSMSALCAESDYITLHAPLTPETRHLIDERSIALMKPTAIVINTGRGGLVEDAHLLAALKAGRLAGAGLDVFISESDINYRAVTDELLALPNVIATPHAGASTREGLARTNMIAARSVVAVFDGKSPPTECTVADGRSGIRSG